MWYGIFQWIFMVVGFICGISALLRLEVFSTQSSQRSGGHSQQQAGLFLLAGVFLLAAFVTAMLAVNHGLR